MKQDLIKFIEDFNLFIKQRDRIAWSVKKIQKVKIRNLNGQKIDECFFQNVQWVIVKNRDLLKNEKLVGYQLL